VFRNQPQIVPAGESLIWALAKEDGAFNERLRYPGETGTSKGENGALGL